jgi:16S rRNA (cytidine1402-2'-O)-methyltransferase
VSGFSTERFVVEGFLPRKGTERKERLRNIGEETRTIVILEAPNRLHHTLLELAQGDPTRRVVVVRELTKLYEEIWRGTRAEGAQAFGARESIKGEITIVLDGATPVSLVVDEETIAHAASAAFIEHRSTKMAADVVAAELGVSRRVAYEAVLRAQEG